MISFIKEYGIFEYQKISNVEKEESSTNKSKALRVKVGVLHSMQS